MGLLSAPNRVSGQRRYELTVFQQLASIQLARQAGFGIRELQTLFSESIDWQTLANEKIVEMEATIARAQSIKLWLTEALQTECVGDCASASIDEAGHVSISWKNEEHLTTPLMHPANNGPSLR